MIQPRSRIIALFIVITLIAAAVLAFWHLATDGPRAPELPSRSRLVLAGGGEEAKAIAQP
ncbi:MAG: hypothetical protein AB1576_02240 [Bacillota bacterium]|jgi:flagellar basal body-associated protein FliL